MNVTRDFGDRSVEITAYQVHISDCYPEGIKYSMQYGNAAGETIILYNNLPNHPDAAHHHKHRADSTVVDVKFDCHQPLFQPFKSEGVDQGHT
ncbi:DUF6516 family protein [Haloarcula sp. H-GB4]|uniref:toxin-antitoxin system TumE family protein n=1 Tax=Haloarcula sp. H-GB4 TaxID=3069755 RepID=UPI0027B41D73|nr:DUF6516 family protein [Haloarcula sp. H-GB4]MDQ2074428.1 DUF6516 family protein [Haloarcula sp. H-GB4]